MLTVCLIIPIECRTILPLEHIRIISTRDTITGFIHTERFIYAIISSPTERSHHNLLIAFRKIAVYIVLSGIPCIFNPIIITILHVQTQELSSCLQSSLPTAILLISIPSQKFSSRLSVIIGCFIIK